MSYAFRLAASPFWSLPLFPYVLCNNYNSFVSSSFNGAATPALNSAKLGVHKSHRKPRSRLKILGALQVTWPEFRAVGPQTLHATEQNVCLSC